MVVAVGRGELRSNSSPAPAPISPPAPQSCAPPPPPPPPPLTLAAAPFQVPDAVGIQVNSWQNRLVAPYLDYVPLVCRGCAVTTVTSAFFLCTQAVFLPDPAGYPVSGVYIAGSEFACLGDGQSDFVALPGAANYTGVQDVSIVGSLSDNPKSVKRSTTIRRSVGTELPLRSCSRT